MEENNRKKKDAYQVHRKIFLLL